jgi:hypothetical protein
VSINAEMDLLKLSINARSVKPNSALTANKTPLNVLNVSMESSSSKLKKKFKERRSLSPLLVSISALKDSSAKMENAKSALRTVLPARTRTPAKSARKDSYSKETNANFNAINSTLKETRNVSDVPIRAALFAITSKLELAKSASYLPSFTKSLALISALAELSLKRLKNSNSARNVPLTAPYATTHPLVKSASPDLSCKKTSASNPAMTASL